MFDIRANSFRPGHVPEAWSVDMFLVGAAAFYKALSQSTMAEDQITEDQTAEFKEAFSLNDGEGVEAEAAGQAAAFVQAEQVRVRPAVTDPAIDESAVVLMTLSQVSLHHYCDTPTKGTGGCSRMSVSSTAISDHSAPSAAF